MAKVKRVEVFGDQLLVRMDDGSRVLAYNSGRGFYLPKYEVYVPPPVDPPDEPDDPGPTDPPPANNGDLSNPWTGWRVTGTWEDHASYSQGGIDRPLPMNTALRAPAAGTVVRTSWTDAAGRRTEFRYDRSYNRVRASSQQLMNGVSREAQGPMVSLVLQHQQSMVGLGHYNKGDIIGYSGASASPSSGDVGGDVHLHYHGLDASGARLDHDKFY